MSIVRANGWQVGSVEQYLAVNPSGEIVSVYETGDNAGSGPGDGPGEIPGKSPAANSGSAPTASTAAAADPPVRRVGERAGFDHIQCVDYCGATPGQVAVGQLDGSCRVFNILQPGDATAQVLKPRQARSCNSVSFNGAGSVAMGYDRGRQDHSIQVWDLAVHTVQAAPPVAAFVSNESVASVTFCGAQSLLAGSYKLLREFDLRAPRAVYQLATRCTHSITPDPFNPHVFVSASEDGTVAVWDRRRLVDASAGAAGNTGTSPLTTSSGMVGGMRESPVMRETPVLVFHKLLGDYGRHAGGGCPYRVSSVVRGEIGALFDGNLVRRWQVGVSPPQNPDKFEQPFIARVGDVRTRYERVISFDYGRSAQWPYGVDLVCMRQSGSIYRMPVVESQRAVRFGCYNTVAFTGPQGSYEVSPVETGEKAEKAGEKTGEEDGVESRDEKIPDREAAGANGAAQGDDGAAQTSKLVRSASTETKDSSGVASIFAENGAEVRLRADALLDNDICTVMRQRARDGYGMRARENCRVLDGLKTLETQVQLRNTWRWLEISQAQSAAHKMEADGYDFGLMGVWGAWNAGKPLAPQQFKDRDYQAANGGAHHAPVLEAVRAIVARRETETRGLAHPVPHSAHALQRRLAMYVIGWDFGKAELERKYAAMVARGDYERAAGWAVFHGDIDRAVHILRSSQREQLRIIAAAISAYSAFRRTQANSPWKDECRRLAAELDNPYLRATFAFVADANWWDVLDESALPLRERLGIALRFLRDDELDVYLARLLGDVIRRGQVEGLIVTGLAPCGIDLLQSFVDRTADCQSACLLACHGCPRYFEDKRVGRWVVAYRRLLDRWGLFSERARFDVARLKISGRRRELAPPRQVYLQCAHCHQDIYGENGENAGATSGAGPGGAPGGSTGVTPAGTPGSAGRTPHVCPHCGYPLPRCAICLITQGVPVPRELEHIDMLAVERANGMPEEKPQPEEPHSAEFKQWFSFCLTCKHCMHAGHAEEWFSKHYVCPVPDCNCRCNSK